MDRLAELESSLTCRPCRPISRPQTPSGSPQKSSSPISNRKVVRSSKNFKITKEISRHYEYIKSFKPIRLHQNKFVCDVGCSTNERNCQTVEPPDIMIQLKKQLESYKPDNTVNFIKLHMPYQKIQTGKNVHGSLENLLKKSLEARRSQSPNGKRTLDESQGSPRRKSRRVKQKKPLSPVKCALGIPL